MNQPTQYRRETLLTSKYFEDFVARHNEKVESQSSEEPEEDQAE